MNLELRNVSKRYGDVQAIKGISLEVPSGKILALLGPSGSGKTTILGIIAGLLTPDSGKVLFDGKDVTTLLPMARSVGMVFQNLALFPNLTVEENIAFPLEARNMNADFIRAKVDEVIDMVELRGLEKRHPHELSGGQQQRVAIGRAISAQVRLLLLDEPLAALDPSLRTEISEVIREIQKRLEVTTVYVTHDQIEAVLMSDLLAVLFDGSLDACGKTNEIYKFPPTETSARFLGASNQLPCTIEKAREDEVTISLNGKDLKVIRPKWWSFKARDAKVLFRPEDAKTVRAGKGVLDGMLRNVIYGGNYVITNVQTNEGIIQCKGNSARAFEVLSKRIGSEVGVSVKRSNMIVF